MDRDVDFRNPDGGETLWTTNGFEYDFIIGRNFKDFHDYKP
jgi:hypothetical protein